MSILQYLLIYIGMPILVSLIGLGVGSFMTSQGLLPADTNTFYFWFFGLLAGIGILFLYIFLSTFKKYQKKIQEKQLLFIPTKKKLPISYSNVFLKALILFTLSYFIFKLLFNNLFTLISQTNIMLIPFAVITIILIVLIIKYDENKGTVLIASKLFEEKFNNVKEFKDFDYKFTEETNPFSRSLQCISTSELSMYDRISKVFATSLNFNYNHRLCTIGTTDLKIRERRGYHNRSTINLNNYFITNIAFLEIEHSIPFEHDIFIRKDIHYYNDVINDKAIFPMYKNMGLIYSTNNEYAERIMTQQVQSYIAELSSHFRNISISFTENKIAIAIKNARWSSWFLRTFFPEKSAIKILESTNIILDYLTKISYEIDKCQ